MSRVVTDSQIALFMLVLSSATITGALIFEAQGYLPCELCLKERIPYYLGIGLSVLTLYFAAKGPKNVVRLGFGALAAIFFASSVFGIYHVGVEFGFWHGPSSCTGTYTQPALVSDLLKELQSVKVVRCDAVSLRLLGLSLAGWNALISACLAGLAGLAAFRLPSLSKGVR